MRLVAVRAPAGTHWDAGHYRSAVADAATNVSQYTQKRLGRYDISEKDLMCQAFTPKPPKPGEPRLRCPGNPKSQTVQSQQEGAMLFAMGAYAALRNPANHLTGDWNPVTAFHYLAAFSIVVEWVKHWDVVYAAPVTIEQARWSPRSRRLRRHLKSAGAGRPSEVMAT